MTTAEPQSRLQSLIDAFTAKRVLVVGDLIADEFIYGEVSRVSREAPVLILKYDTTEVVPGGAGNAANNVASLGARAVLAGMAGTDGEGRRLLAAFPGAVDTTAGGARAALSNPGEDAHPCGRHPLGQAAGRADRSRDRLAARRRGESGIRREADAGARRVRRRPAVGLRLGPGHAGARSGHPDGPRCAAARAGRFRSWSTAGIGCSTSGA